MKMMISIAHTETSRSLSLFLWLAQGERYIAQMLPEPECCNGHSKPQDKDGYPANNSDDIVRVFLSILDKDGCSFIVPGREGGQRATSRRLLSLQETPTRN